MKIGIDARLYGPQDTGIGRYVQNLIDGLIVSDQESQYILFIQKRNKKVLEAKITKSGKSNFRAVIANARHYSFKEQLLMPYLVWREKINLMHYPHFNVPLFFPGKYVVTIHDLIKHHSFGPETTTRTPLFYWFKLIAYKLVFQMAVKRASLVFTPSEAVAGELIQSFGLRKDKVRVAYEGVDPKLQVEISDLSSPSSKLKGSFRLPGNFRINKPFLVYTGNVYPHKNVDKLIEAVKILNGLVIKNQELKVRSGELGVGKKNLTDNSLSLVSYFLSPISLVIVCGRSVFWERLAKKVTLLKAGSLVKMVGFLPDKDLKILYQRAFAFVSPTLIEGFGLHGLEAMASGLPVLASEIPVYKEIYDDAVIYFNPHDPADIARKIYQLFEDQDLYGEFRERGLNCVKKYSWEKMAKEILDGYRSV